MPVAVNGSFPSVPEAAVATEARWGSFTESYVLGMSGTVTASGLVLTIAPCQAFALDTTSPARLQGFSEGVARTVILPATDGTYWILGRALTAVEPAGWTSLPGVHYAWRQSPTMPVAPSGTVLLASALVSGGTITQVWDEATRIITTPVTVPAGYQSGPRSRLIIQEHGRLVVGSGQTVALRGPVEAGRWHVFDLTAAGSAVTFPTGGTVYPEWWGALADDTTPSAAAITAALRANPYDMDVALGEGVYAIEAAITPPLSGPTVLESGSRLRGMGQEMTVLRRTTSYLGPLLQLNLPTGPTPAFVTRFNLADMLLDGRDRAAGTVGVQSGWWGEANVTRVRIQQCDIGWQSLGTMVSVWFEQLSIWECGDGFLQDSTSPTSNGASGIHFEGGRWRNNVRNSYYLKNSGVSPGGNRTRTMSFSGTTFEGTKVTTGTNCAVRIENGETIQFTGVHFEQHAPHVHISGTGQTFPSRHLTFSGCNFGNVHALAPEPKLVFVWEGDDAQGAGSWVENCLIGGQGEWRINHTGTVFQVRNVTLGQVEIFGRYVQDYARGSVPHVVTRGETTVTPWFMRRTEKPWGTASLVQLDERILSATTTDATPTAIAVYSEEVALPDGATMLVLVELVCRQQDNSDQGAWSKAGVFKNVGGTISQVGATGSLHPDIESNAALDVVLNAGTAVDAARIIVTGLAEASPIDWYGSSRTYRVMAPPEPEPETRTDDPAWEALRLAYLAPARPPTRGG